jgi:hypothetical protein
MPEVENADVEQNELEIQVTKATRIIQAALEFYAVRSGRTVSEYIFEAILRALEGEEKDGFNCGGCFTNAVEEERGAYARRR